MFNLLAGILVLTIGVAFLVLNAYQFIREQSSKVQVGPPPIGERLASVVFLGVVPVIAGSIFLAAWWNDTHTESQVPPMQAVYAPLR